MTKVYRRIIKVFTDQHFNFDGYNTLQKKLGQKLNKSERLLEYPKFQSTK